MSETRTADVRPFSSGTEGYDWMAGNCDRCAKNGPYDSRGAGPCPMETAVARGFILGTVSADLASEYGATVQGEHARMPRECSQFAPLGACEWVNWPGTRRSTKCGEPMESTVIVNGHTRPVCAKHLKRYQSALPSTPEADQ